MYIFPYKYSDKTIQTFSSRREKEIPSRYRGRERGCLADSLRVLLSLPLWVFVLPSCNLFHMLDHMIPFSKV